MTVAASRRTQTIPRRSGGGPRRRTAKIIEAAAEVFARRGYHGASTQDIADVLGIRQASLYYYFPSKDAALEHVCLRGAEGYAETAEAIAKEDAPAAAKVRKLIKSHLQPLEDRRAFVTVFLRERHHLPDESRRRVGRISRRYERQVQEVMRSGVRSGEFRADLDPRLATLALLGMCNAVPEWYGIEPNATIARIAEAFGDLFIEGLQGKSKRRAEPSKGRA